MKMRKHIVFKLLSLLTATLLVQTVQAIELNAEPTFIITKGLSKPESAYFINKHIYISNIDGDSSTKDGSGWISKVDAKGKMLNEKWVKGLNAPKGLRSWNNWLLVTDIDQLVVINLKNGKIVRKISLPNAKFLNDVAVDQHGNAYVSDTMQSAIYQVSGFATAHPQSTVWITGLEQAPNGLYADKDRLVIASWGSQIADGFKVKDLGGVYSIGYKNKDRQDIAVAPIANLDGLERMKDGSWLFSAKIQDRLYHIAQGQADSRVLRQSDRKLTSSNTSEAVAVDAADIGLMESHKLILVPNMLKNQVTAIGYH